MSILAIHNLWWLSINYPQRRLHKPDSRVHESRNSTMKIEIIGYVPPRGIGHPEAYLANIGAFKTEFPVSLFSDYPDWGLRQSDNPGKVKHRQFGHWVSNYAFFIALQYAVACKLDYFLYLEEDCRVRGDGWDGRMMEEAYEQNP